VGFLVSLRRFQYGIHLIVDRIVAIIVGFALCLLFLFVPETFWDRTPTRSKNKKRTKHSAKSSSLSLDQLNGPHEVKSDVNRTGDATADNKSLRRQAVRNASNLSTVPSLNAPPRRASQALHVGFAPGTHDDSSQSDVNPPPETAATVAASSTEHPLVQSSNISCENQQSAGDTVDQSVDHIASAPTTDFAAHSNQSASSSSPRRPRLYSFRLSYLGNLDKEDLALKNSLAHHEFEKQIRPTGDGPPTPGLHSFNSPFYVGIEREDSDYLSRGRESPGLNHDGGTSTAPTPARQATDPTSSGVPTYPTYTATLKESPRRSFLQQLRICHGRLHDDNWFHVAIRPFILYAYPAVLWSSIVYACSIGWLIVLSESVSKIYRTRTTYGFSALSTGLIYLSPFIGGILGTAVAGKLSDVVVRAMSRRNGGLYEPEFRLVMAMPVAVTTVIGLMGFGWSAEVHDAWIVPTIFFGVISFGCSLGSTTAITFVVDSYRQYAGEALVTLNFTKNIFHGLVFSLFFTKWLEADGSKSVFLALGGIQLALLLLTVPMYIWGKRFRMWTVRKNLMEKF
jgi:hypothetical protein